MYNNIPAEMRQLNQWINWANATKPDGSPTKIPINPKSLQQNIWQPVDVTNPTNFVSFNEAVAVATANNIGIGFVLTPLDPMVCIDLDDKPENPATDHERAVHEKMLKEFYAQGAYIEQSPSGTGWHIWTRGAWPANARHRSGHIEVYDRARFITCTGVGKPLAGPMPFTQQSLNDWAEAMGETRPAVNGAYALDQIDSGLSDEQVAQAVLASDSSTKFISLCKGEWQALGYPSQSEADFALLSILAFYSVDNAQVRRMFRDTALGQRAKAQRNDYIDRSLGTIRARAGALSAEQHAIAKASAQAIAANAAPREKVAPPPPPELLYNSTMEFPGLVGRISQFARASAPYPVPEFAPVGGLAMMAAIGGHACKVDGEHGLNQYFILMGEAGLGKEGPIEAIERLVSEVRRRTLIGPPHERTSMIDRYFKGGDVGSGEGIEDHVLVHQSSLIQMGEIGQQWERWHNDNNANGAGIRGALSKVWSASKAGRTYHRRLKARGRNATGPDVVESPALTILGHTVPDILLPQLTIDCANSGLLPRFNIIESSGKVEYAENRILTPPQDLIQDLTLLVTRISNAESQGFIDIPLDPGAKKLKLAFIRECDALKADKSMPWRALWSRTYEKAIRLSGAIALGVNWWDFPTVTAEIMAQAIEYERNLTLRLVAHYARGETGDNTDNQIHELRRILERWVNGSVSQEKKLTTYRCTPAMLAAGMITGKYIKDLLRTASCFKKDKRFTSRWIEDAIKTLRSSGELVDPSDKERLAFGLAEMYRWVQ